MLYLSLDAQLAHWLLLLLFGRPVGGSNPTGGLPFTNFGANKHLKLNSLHSISNGFVWSSGEGKSAGGKWLWVQIRPCTLSFSHFAFADVMMMSSIFISYLELQNAITSTYGFLFWWNNTVRKLLMSSLIWNPLLCSLEMIIFSPFWWPPYSVWPTFDWL